MINYMWRSVTHHGHNSAVRWSRGVQAPSVVHMRDVDRKERVAPAIFGVQVCAPSVSTRVCLVHAWFMDIVMLFCVAV